jgi:hypothetical protein
MWPENGAITDKSMQFTIDFNVNRGYLQPGLKTADVWDPQVLADAVKLIGAVAGKP